MKRVDYCTWHCANLEALHCSEALSLGFSTLMEVALGLNLSSVKAQTVTMIKEIRKDGAKALLRPVRVLVSTYQTIIVLI